MADDPPIITRNLPAPGGHFQSDDYIRRIRGHKKFSAGEIKAALAANFGNPRMAARWLMDADQRAGGNRTVNPVTIREYIKRRGWQFSVRAEGRNDIIDLAETVIVSRMKGGDAATARFVLDRLGRDHGYITTEKIIVLDPAELTVAQLCQLLDASRMTEEQIDAVLLMWEQHFDFAQPPNGQGPIIDMEPIDEGETP
jgi:hypothetical protein